MKSKTWPAVKRLSVKMPAYTGQDYRQILTKYKRNNYPGN
jgi:hypothetical protein